MSEPATAAERLMRLLSHTSIQGAAHYVEKDLGLLSPDGRILALRHLAAIATNEADLLERFRVAQAHLDLERRAR